MSEFIAEAKRLIAEARKPKLAPEWKDKPHHVAINRAFEHGAGTQHEIYHTDHHVEAHRSHLNKVMDHLESNGYKTSEGDPGSDNTKSWVLKHKKHKGHIKIGETPYHDTTGYVQVHKD